MEYFWYIVAALGAGVGTGLAGLSAATVMVPILIVLCPSFSGDTGAYQATAIALASDILGSAVAAATYAKHGEIDLRRGWIMLVCIVAMCTVGSYAAWLAGNVVLGTFSLILTLGIGIRFLVSPAPKRKPAPQGGKLDWKGIAVSLFFGLTIGFGTGFVGTGGGMMMLIVFTAFLHMPLKTAVGTSTFIMTFTALIASVSHILIHPAILLERWDALLICVVTATAASLVSARYANRVSDRKVGLTTGVVLTILGAAMLLLNYWPTLSQYPLFIGTLRCLGGLALYIIVCIAVLLAIRWLLKPPQFVWRKLLHAVAFTCIVYMVLTADSWQSAALASCLVAILLYPALVWAEKNSHFSRLLAEKGSGEIKASLLMLFLTAAALITIGAGIFDAKNDVVIAVLMWGVGDAAAALVGIPYGRHKVRLPLTDGKKSWEGTAAMFAASFAAGAAACFFLHVPFPGWLIPVAVGAALGAATELFSPSAYDTITVPTIVLIVLLAIGL